MKKTCTGDHLEIERIHFLRKWCIINQTTIERNSVTLGIFGGESSLFMKLFRK